MYALLMLIATVGVNPHADGTLIVFKGGLFSNFMEAHTGSPYTHIAILLYEDNIPMVYEAYPPAVRKMTFEKFMRHSKTFDGLPWNDPLQVLFVMPDRPFTEEELEKMKIVANAKIGHKYNVLSALRRTQTVRATHCAGFVGEVIEVTGRLKADLNHELPYSILQKLDMVE